MKTKPTLFWGLAVASAAGGLVLWRSQHHRPLPSVALSQLTAPSSATAPGGAAKVEAGTRITICQTPEEEPAWAIKYGQEFWRRPPPAHSLSRALGPGEARAAIDLGSVIDRVSHAFTASAPGGSPRVQAQTYVAELKAGTLELSPARPPQRTSLAPSAASNAPPGPSSGLDQRLAAMVSRTPETAEEEEWLMARTSEIAAEEANRSTADSGVAHSSSGNARRSSPQMDPQTKAAFQTVSVRAGDHLLYDAMGEPLSWSVLGNTAQALLEPTGGLVEHFEANAQGVAVSWVLSRPPHSTEPLTLTARLTGLAYAGRTANGHHFVDSSGISRICVGNVTVADSAGGRWEVPMQAQGDAMAVTVPSTILAQATYPLAVDPVIAPEFGMDLPITVAAPAAQQNPAVAANGGSFFVAWEDLRASGGGAPSIYGTRVTGAGGISDPNGIAISPVGASSPAVAPNGSGYLVVWADGRNVATTGLDIYGARVSSAGQVLDSGGLPISQAAGDQFAPAATANGTGSFVVWQDGRNVDTGPDIYGARVTSGGVVSDTTGIPISTALGAQASPAVTFNGANFLVVWSDQRGGGDFYTYGARVSPAGVVLDTTGVPISTVAGGEFYPKVAASGTNFLVVWEDDRNAGTAYVDIYAARVSGAGAVLDRGGFPVGTGFGDRHSPAVAAGLTDYLVVWQDSRNLGASGEDIYGARVSTTGTVTDSTGFAISMAADDQSTPALAFEGTQYLVVWTDARNLATTDLDIYGALVSPAAVVSPAEGILITTGSSDERRPAVASNGSNYLVVWQDFRNALSTGTDLYGVRVSTTGAVLDLNAIPISTAAADQVFPAVATAGTDYLVVWVDYRNSGTTGADIYGTRVTAAGVVQDPGGIPISTANSDQLVPVVAGSAGGYFVVWQDGRNLGTSSSDIYGARVSTAGSVLDANGLPICTANAAQYSAAVAFNGANYLVAWSDERNLGVTGVDIYGTRVSPAGAVLDSPNLPVSQAAGDAVFPAVASSGTGFLVVWEDGRNLGTSGDNIYGARVSGAGVVTDPSGIAIAVAPGFQAVPAAAASGTNYLVVWQDGRNGGLTGTDIYGARVTTGGTVLDAAGLAINTGAFDQQNPKLASGSTDVFLTVCQSVENGSMRAVGNFVYLDDFPIITHIAASGGSATLTWLSVPNRSYRVQFKTSLASLFWSNLVPDILASGTVATQVDNAAGPPGRYYRVVLLP